MLDQMKAAGRTCRVVIALVLLEMAVFGFSRNALAQCPSSATPIILPNRTIYFKFSQYLTDGYQQAQIVDALTKIRDATSVNGVNVNFAYEDVNHQATLVFDNVATVYLTCSPSTQTDSGVGTTVTVRFYVNGHCGPDSNPILNPPLISGGEPGYDTIFTKLALHEVTHAMGLNHIPAQLQIPGGSVQNNYPSVANPNTNDAAGIQPADLSTCDKNQMKDSYFPPPPTGGGGGGCPNAVYPELNSVSEVSPQLCVGCNCSPIVIDVSGNGFEFTGPDDGVIFDIRGNWHPQQMAWTSPGSDDAFLALDRNGNGVIDDGSELFGDSTAQPVSDEPNGFLALAEFDKPSNGGNGDHWITEDDAIFTDLRLWQDTNHDGLSQSDELHSLPELGVRAIDLSYHESRRTDSHGNQLRYRARVVHERGAHDGRWAVDVFFVMGE